MEHRERETTEGEGAERERQQRERGKLNLSSHLCSLPQTTSSLTHPNTQPLLEMLYSQRLAEQQRLVMPVSLENSAAPTVFHNDKREREREREREQNNIAATILHSHCSVYTFTGQNICHRCFHSHGYYRCFYSQGKASVTAVFPFTGQNVCHLCVSIHRAKRLSPLCFHSQGKTSVTSCLLYTSDAADES